MNSNRKRTLSNQSTMQSSFLDAESFLGKENIEQEARLLVPTLLPSRARKNSDNSFDRPLKHRGLQEIDNLNRVEPRRRIKSSKDDGAAVPDFSKAPFTIYDEAKSNPDIRNTEKLKPKSYRPLAPLDCGKTNLCIRKNRGHDESNDTQSSRSSYQQPTFNPRTSPADLPVIPRSNISKIKEEHRRASLIKKKQRQVYDILSLELAYNVNYMSEYVKFQMEINDKNRLSPNFLSQSISADQRRLVVKYLIGSTAYYKYPSFILYQAVKIFDCYIDSVKVKLQELQILALASLWIALKKDHTTDDIPEASTIINLGGPVFNGNKKPLIECERKILAALNFDISFSDPFSMLSVYVIMIEEVRNLESSKVEELYYSGSYLIDLSLLLEDIANISAVHLAAISLEIALVLTMSSDENLKNPQWSHWRKVVLSVNGILERYRLPNSEMDQIRNKLLQKVIMSSDSKEDFYVVYKKYSSKRYGPVSRFMISKVSTLLKYHLVRFATPTDF